MKNLIYIVLLGAAISCQEAATSEIPENIETLTRLPVDWNIFNTKIELNNAEFYFSPDDSTDLLIEFNWNSNNYDLDTLSTSKKGIPYIYTQRCMLQITDLQKIKENVDYTIPSISISLSTGCLGLLSNFEEFKKLNGKIRFETISENTCKFKILLMGELNEMINLEYDTILHEEINIIQ